MKISLIEQLRRYDAGRFGFTFLRFFATITISTVFCLCSWGPVLAQFPSPMQQWNYLNRVQATHKANFDRIQREQAAAQRAAAQRSAAQREAARREREYAQREAARREAAQREVALREINKPTPVPPITSSRPIAPRPESGPFSKPSSEERQLRIAEEQLKETRSQVNALLTHVKQQQEKEQLSEGQLKELRLKYERLIELLGQREAEREWYKRKHEETVGRLEQTEDAKKRLENMYEPPSDTDEIFRRIKPTSQLIEESENLRRERNTDTGKNLTSEPIAMRTWTSISGKYSREAKYLSSTNTDVMLELADGTTRLIGLAKLSADDCDYVKRQQEAEKKTN